MFTVERFVPSDDEAVAAPSPTARKTPKRKRKRAADEGLVEGPSKKLPRSEDATGTHTTKEVMQKKKKKKKKARSSATESQAAAVAVEAEKIVDAEKVAYSASGSAEKAEDSASGSSDGAAARKAKKKEKRAKRKKNKELLSGFLDFEGKPYVVGAAKDAKDAKASSAVVNHPAIQYLQEFIYSRPTWKFHKNRQLYLIRNMYTEEKIPEQYFECMLRYIVTIKGGNKERILQEAKSIVADKENEDASPSDEASDEAADNPPADSSDANAKRERAQRIIDALSSGD